MIYVEMSRTIRNRTGPWSFPNSVWSPTRKKPDKGKLGGRWPFWSKITHVRVGDTIIHLRGITPKANFVGYSTVSSDGFQTASRPPNPGPWGFADSFFRADLTNYTPFHEPINLAALFVDRRQQLDDYFDLNRARSVKDRANIFYVRQAGKLQCLNGAYLSDVDDELQASTSAKIIVSVPTASQLAEVRVRLGQSKFSNEVKRLYSSRCCFPGCDVTDRRFLVGAHIARWTDNEKLRGHLGNGLCLCLMHDRAFELGLFTLDSHYRIFTNPKHKGSDSPVMAQLASRHGHKIGVASVLPLDDALITGALAARRHRPGT
jgi:putative restriction endonuclease